MRVLIFGASGMVGQGVLRECVQDAAVIDVLCVGRSALPRVSGKVKELVCGDLFDLTTVEGQLAGFDACFFCLGVSSGGMSEPEYRRLTYDLTLSIARTLVRLNPGMIFEYVSGASTDSTEKGSTMWARVKGQTENALLGLGFKGAYMFRPGMIQPLDGIQSKTKSYRILYSILGPLLPLLKRLFPKYVTSTQEVGRAMIAVAKHGYAKTVIEADEIGAIAMGHSG
ncbi:epimerase [soil metagenome]